MSYPGAIDNSMNENTLIQDKSSGYCLRSLKTGEEFPLQQEMLVGREVECQITLDSGHISRYHAKLTLAPDGGVVVEDLRSTNGTFINGRRISAPQTLALGDEIRFHEQAFRLVSTKDESGAADATLFESMGNQAESLGHVPVSAPEPAQDEDEGTSILSAEDVQRLQGKGHRLAKGPENGTGPRFVVLSAPIRGKVFSLLSQQRNAWLIGRDDRCQFNLFDKTVSGEHARVRRLGDDWVLEACESRNPIYINNRPVDISTLQHGDVIRIGRMELMFRTDEHGSIKPEVKEARFVASKFNIGLVIGALVTLALVVGIVLL